MVRDAPLRAAPHHEVYFNFLTMRVYLNLLTMRQLILRRLRSSRLEG
jgi:hypothetical protein